MPTINNTYFPSSDGSAGSFFAVTPSDVVGGNFTTPARGLYVGVAGNVSVVPAVGAAVTFVGVPAGYILPVEAIRVNATGTTATSIVGLV
jgi:hypothetical protein